jgi:hypothetical protein
VRERVNWDIATVSVVASAIVGVTGVVLPAVTRRGDREHVIAVRERASIDTRSTWPPRSAAMR